MDFMDACQGSLKFCSLVLGMDNVQQTLCLVVCNFICISAFVVMFLNICLCFCIWMIPLFLKFLHSWPALGQMSRQCLHKVKSFVIFYSWNRVNPSNHIWQTQNNRNIQRPANMFRCCCFDSFWPSLTSVHFTSEVAPLLGEKENVYFSTPLAVVGCIGPVTGVITVTAPLHWAPDSSSNPLSEDFFKG